MEPNSSGEYWDTGPTPVCFASLLGLINPIFESSAQGCKCQCSGWNLWQCAEHGSTVWPRGSGVIAADNGAVVNARGGVYGDALNAATCFEGERHAVI
jgi:hypothetical protein